LEYTLRKYQRDAVDKGVAFLKSPDKYNAIEVLPTGCHAKGTKVILYNGDIINVEDVRIGDYLLAPDSSSRKVLKLCRGVDAMYKITPHKGIPFVVNGNHILYLVCTPEHKNRRQYPSTKKGGEIEHISVNDYLGKKKYWKHLRKLAYSHCVEFINSSKNFSIPPYILGALLGDGCVLYNTVSITTMDNEISNEFIKYAYNHNLEIRFATKKYNKASSLYLVKRENRHNRMFENPLMHRLRKLGIDNKKSGNKFIPHKYKIASKNSRLEILAGLLDTDGYYSSGYYDYVSKSKQLANDVALLLKVWDCKLHRGQNIKK